jgi:hypothetical protein
MIQSPSFLKEGNLYNVQTVRVPDQGEGTGLDTWKKEVKKQLLDHLRQRNIKNIDQIIQQTFGTTLE